MFTSLNFISVREIIILFALFFWVTSGHAQVQIAPVALYLDEENKTGRIVVRNSSGQSIELSTELLFGYPATNYEGKVHLKLFENKNIPREEPSAKEWIRVYPRHLILPPQEQQTIRFAVRPPRNLPNGEYWVRPSIVARPVEPVASQATDEISTRLNIIKRTILSLNYRHGNVRTGISIQHATVHLQGHTLHLKTDLRREGNAAYLGYLDVFLKDASGRIRKQLRKEIAVYHQIKPTYQFDVGNLPPGSYSAQIILDTKDRAEDTSGILNAPPASTEVEFVIK